MKNMKTKLVISLIGLISLGACKKDYTCSCDTSKTTTFPDNSPSVTTDKEYIGTIKSSKSKAEDFCSDYKESLDGELNSGSSSTATVECELK
jgi:putative IMPACT (imprinted ancient) family translation regulator